MSARSMEKSCESATSRELGSRYVPREGRMVFHRGDGREKRERLKFSDWKIEARNDNKFQTRRA